MDISLDPKWEAFIAEQIASGAYATAEEVVAAGLTRLEADDDLLAGWDIDELRAEIQKGVDQIERGEYTTYDAAGLRALGERIKQRCRRLQPEA